MLERGKKADVSSSNTEVHTRSQEEERRSHFESGETEPLDKASIIRKRGEDLRQAGKAHRIRQGKGKGKSREVGSCMAYEHLTGEIIEDYSKERGKAHKGGVGHRGTT